MLLTVTVRVTPDRQQGAALAATLRACNAAANAVAAAAREGAVTERQMRGACYTRLKSEFGLGAQAAQQCIRKVVDARRTAKKQKRGRPDSVKFRPMSSQAFDDRCLSWQADSDTVSIWTTAGRLRGVRICPTDEQRKLLARRRGESNLVWRDGMWFLAATVDVEPEPFNENPAGWIGVDLGQAEIAVTSTGQFHSGKTVSAVRARHHHTRQKLQRKGTRSAKRLLRKRRRKEARFVRDTNHRISKSIVREAQRTGTGIALENLEGIRDRVTVRKPQRRAMHSWSFHQLRSFVTYKAERAGVPVVVVDPAYTSQACPGCGNTSRRNRPRRDTFCCTDCGLAGHADLIAAANIAQRAVSGGGAPVNGPYAPRPVANRYQRRDGTHGETSKPSPSGLGS